MALIDLKKLLTHARDNKYAIGGFELSNLDWIDSIIEVAEEEKSPIILQLAEIHFNYLNLENVAPALINSAMEVNIPVCVHLDHGQSLKTVIRAIRAGFNSVMFDGSKYSLEENINKTKEVVKIAHSVGVSVEAELGHVGGEAVGTGVPVAHESEKELFTKVEDSVRFCKETKVDALAIAIGNVHGFYKGKPNLDFDRLIKIRDATNIPLVIHGASGISNEDIKKLIELGVCKINYYTDMSVGAVKSVRDYLLKNPEMGSYPDVINKGMEGLKRVVREKIRLFNSKNVCDPSKTLCISCSEGNCESIDSISDGSSDDITYKQLVDRISDEVISFYKNKKDYK
jgi:fructose-bisphosphate aldolase class II